jgi:hypothetical protein
MLLAFSGLQNLSKKYCWELFGEPKWVFKIFFSSGSYEGTSQLILLVDYLSFSFVLIILCLGFTDQQVDITFFKSWWSYHLIKFFAKFLKKKFFRFGVSLFPLIYSLRRWCEFFHKMLFSLDIPLSVFTTVQELPFNKNKIFIDLHKQ